VTRFVADFDADHTETAFAEGAGLGALNFDCDRCGLAGLEVPELSNAEIAVAPRDVEEEVADGADAGFGRCFSGLRTDAFQCAQALLEDARAGPVDRGIEQIASLQLAGAGEGARYWAARSHHQLGCPPS